MNPIPVVLFTYARPRHLSRVLACWKTERPPMLYVFSDGAKNSRDAGAVAETRTMLRAIDWTDLKLTERPSNYGLGRNVLTGVSEVAAHHEAFVVCEDDLVFVPGTYEWLCTALRHYEHDSRVMSVTAWNHPRVTPAEVSDQPYFDGRAECWLWGAWARSWKGMLDSTALQKLKSAESRGIPANAYGADLPLMAQIEQRKNIWAVRWLYHHLDRGGLCLRPPWSLVENIGFDASGSHAAGATEWLNPPLRDRPSLPVSWPAAAEHPSVCDLWRAAYPQRTWPMRFLKRLRAATIRRLMKRGNS